MIHHLVREKVLMVRGHRVILDKDLAELFDVKPIRLREQVKRNPEKFPGHFMFHLTADETAILVSQNAIPSKQHLGGHLPYAFTEYGILQLANVLRSKRAILMSIRIIEVFISMREMMMAHHDIMKQLEALEKQVVQHGDEIQALFAALKQLLQPRTSERKPIGFTRGREQ